MASPLKRRASSEGVNPSKRPAISSSHSSEQDPTLAEKPQQLPKEARSQPIPQIGQFKTPLLKQVMMERMRKKSLGLEGQVALLNLNGAVGINKRSESVQEAGDPKTTDLSSLPSQHGDGDAAPHSPESSSGQIVPTKRKRAYIPKHLQMPQNPFQPVIMHGLIPPPPSDDIALPPILFHQNPMAFDGSPPPGTLRKFLKNKIDDFRTLDPHFASARDLDRVAKLEAIERNLKTSLPLPRTKEVRKSRQPEADYSKLPVMKINRLEDIGSARDRPQDRGEPFCDFCVLECDYGVCNESTWLPLEASSGLCEQCVLSTTQFGLGTRKDDEEDDDILSPLARIMLKGSISSEPRKKVTSVFDKKDITKYQKVLFCAGSPWRQIDINLVNICFDCRNQKLQIIKHGPHTTFASILSQTVDWDDVEGEIPLDSSHRSRRCMICVGHATEICATGEGCPLRLCGNCRVLLTDACKGWLDNLFYCYGNEHLRNDAFLLRFDGGGF